MNEIIKIENNTAVLSAEFSKQVAYVKEQLKELKKLDEEYSNMILKAMEQNKIVKLENDDLIINYIQPTDRETFDSKAFKEDNPDIYDVYVKISPVKSSVRIKVK